MFWSVGRDAQSIRSMPDRLRCSNDTLFPLPYRGICHWPAALQHNTDKWCWSVLSTSRMLHDPAKLYLPSFGRSLQQILANKTVLNNDDIHIQMRFAFSAMLKVALPCHEGPHSSGCQRGWVHPEQAASRGRPQTRRVWGINRLWNDKLLTIYGTEESIINSEEHYSRSLVLQIEIVSSFCEKRIFSQSLNELHNNKSY